MGNYFKKNARNFVFSFLIVAAFFLVLEIASRVIYSLYIGSPSYLTYGFSSIFRPEKKVVPSGKPIFRIACFGGSTTEGIEQNNYPMFLEEYLQDKFPDRQIIVENFGIGGATTTEVTYMLRASIDMDITPHIWGVSEEKIKRLCGPQRNEKIPDLVFLYSQANACLTETLRLKELLSEKEYNEIRYLTPKISLRGQPLFVRLALRLNYYLRSKSFFFYGLSRIIFWVQHERYLFPQEKINKGMNVIDTSVQTLQKKISRYHKSVKYSNFEESLNMAVYTAKRQRVPIIVGTEPIASRKLAGLPVVGNPLLSVREEESYAIVHEIYSDVIRRICYENDALLFDAVKLFEDTPDSDTFFVDRVHLSERGNRFLAKKIGDFIIGQGLIK